MMAVLSVLAGMGVGLAMNPISAALQPISRDIAQRAWAFHPIKQSDVLTLINLRIRHKIDDKEFTERMKELGFDDKKSEEYLEVAKQLLRANELIQAKWRGIISEKEYYEKMEANGYDKETADKLEQVMKYYPSPMDFIRFAVRDVFKEERVRKYELDKEFPTEITKYAKKIGLDEEVLRWYWRSHWNLPSPEQVMRMVNILQPAVLETKLPNGQTYGEKYKEFGIDYKKIETTYDDLSEYLAMADISPYWRDRFKALTFPPLTRVDLRRIYALGLISDEELFARLLELGYSKLDAERLMQFYKLYKHQSGRTLTRTMIVDAYLEQLITKDDAVKLMEQIGYDKEEATFILQLAEAKEKQKDIKQEIDIYVKAYSRGIITEQELKDKLTKLKLTQDRIDYYVEKAKLMRHNTTKLPSKSDIKKWLEDGIITEQEFVNLMKQLGYQEQFIQYYLAEVKSSK